MSNVTMQDGAVTDTMVDVTETALRAAAHSREVALRAQRYGRIELFILCGVLILILVAGGITIYFDHKGSDRAALSRHQDCVATALVGYAAATGEAFSGPDAPTMIRRAARDLRAEVRAC